MIKLYKYSYYKKILLKFIFIIFIYTPYVYADTNKNVASSLKVFTTSVIKFNSINSRYYSLKSNYKNELFISSDKGVLIFNDFNFSLLPFQKPVFDVIYQNDTLYCLTENNLVEITNYSDQNPDLKVRKSFTLNLTAVNPPQLFLISDNFYIFSKPYLYHLDSIGLTIIRSDISDVLTYRNALLLISQTGVLFKLLNQQIEEIQVKLPAYNNIRFITSDANINLITENKIFELVTDKNFKLINHKQHPLKDNLKSTIGLFNSYFLTNPTANYLFFEYPGDLNSYQVPVINPFITQLKYCTLDNNNNIWLLFNEGLLMISCTENISDLQKKLPDNGELSGSIGTETSLFLPKPQPFYLSTLAFIIYGFIGLIIIYFIFLRRNIKLRKNEEKIEKIITERTAEILKEKDKTDVLLANLLPKDTAAELRDKGKATSQKYELVTVLFSDIQGFTKIAEELNPEKLIDQLDNFFFHFDSVVEKYNIEKIKTIGDAYMCAGGIPYKNRTNPVEVVLAALEMQEYMRQIKSRDKSFWDLRIGIHTGGVIAGVVGHKRLSYDIWGDTVNTASRMESSGEAGKINISGHTYELVKEFFICEYRGRMPVKYKGDIDMYFVKGIRPELSIDLKTIPNRKFFIQLQLLRLIDLEEFVIHRINSEMVKNYYFHSTKHTRDIFTQAELLSRAENITHEELLLVCTSALLFDVGFITDYYNHIIHSVNFAREYLPKFKYSGDQIETICNLLLSATTENKTPNHLESILIDSRYNYFGRVDYIEKIKNLVTEIAAWVPGFNPKEFINQQIERIRKFTFFTNTAQRLRDVTSEEQIIKLEKLLDEY